MFFSHKPFSSALPRRSHTAAQAVTALRNRQNLLFFILIFLLCFNFQGSSVAADLTTKRYEMATAYYNDLRFDNECSRDRSRWLICADKFRKIYHNRPTHKKAAACLYRLGGIYENMFRHFKTSYDLHEAVAYYEDLQVIFPGSNLADDAIFRIAGLRLDQNRKEEARKFLTRIINEYPDGDMHKNATAKIQEIQGIKTIRNRKSLRKNYACLSSPVRYWSNPDYTRVVIRVSDQINYQEVLLPDDENHPKRLYVDLEHCSLSPEVKSPVPVDDGLLKRIRTGQFDPDTVRVVLDTQTLEDYKIFDLKDPYRIIIDISGTKAVPSRPTRLPEQGISLAEQFGLGIKTIVLDPGHGGKDPGAVSPSGLMEKDIVLEIAKKTARILNRKKGYNVILTRTEDVFIPLEERTALANTHKADLFVSIHVNAAANPGLQGLETYYLNMATSREERRAAARENSSSASQLSDLQRILDDLMKKSKKEESYRLAKIMHRQLIRGLENSYGINDLGVKKAPFIVLIGARMPAILLETGFISNHEEEKRLCSRNYQGILARQITRGIVDYASNLNMAARF